ncbi:hypothetical protein PFICI_15290 [Pestalotiopsis fici W106-1]|uniref:Uncharacterized protein n=1 Tax=Pestalotiopsis fici (strain W106-1 / CGMCC3.15140) TaxID=1229662 RepID=W3WG58_PESFW|nr:uncharacterized protein PFICI_15290 [Pestalotiopsis fici W106-1]ETS72898.1 hypothetical protein PFICI_15290 [Pestalotiopsis fici W106-1]
MPVSSLNSALACKRDENKSDNFSQRAEVISALASRVKGRTFVTTGANAQCLGGQIATTLASGSPAQIILASRTANNVQPVLDSIKAIDSSIKTTYVPLDLTDRDSVKNAAETILATAPKIDVLINNAGIMAVLDYTKDKHGVELQFSANHVGPFLFTNLLVTALEAAGPGSRVVNVSSQAYRCSPVQFEDWNFSDGKTYDIWTSYGQSKTANILFAVGLTKRLSSRGITASALHPGLIMGTSLGTHLDQSAFANVDEITPQTKTIEQGAATPLMAALDPEIVSKSPAYITNAKGEKPYEFADDAELADKLWVLSEEILGQKFSY